MTPHCAGVEGLFSQTSRQMVTALVEPLQDPAGVGGGSEQKLGDGEGEFLAIAL